MKNKYHIEVQAARRVLAPIYGQEAYHIEPVCFDFPYGKGVGKYKNYDKAYIDALLKGIELMPDATAVAIVDWRGLYGTCHYIKDTNETFSTGWPNETPE